MLFFHHKFLKDLFFLARWKVREEERERNINEPEKDRSTAPRTRPVLEPNLPPRCVSCPGVEPTSFPSRDDTQPPEPHQSGPFPHNLKKENQFFTF